MFYLYLVLELHNCCLPFQNYSFRFCFRYHFTILHRHFTYTAQVMGSLCDVETMKRAKRLNVLKLNSRASIYSGRYYVRQLNFLRMHLQFRTFIDPWTASGEADLKFILSHKIEAWKNILLPSGCIWMKNRNHKKSSSRYSSQKQ